MNRPATFAERLNSAIEMKQITKAELSRMTGISKSSLTRYTKGDWEGKQDAVYAIAQALNVSEAWLMGYDVPMQRIEVSEENWENSDLPEIPKAKQRKLPSGMDPTPRLVTPLHAMEFDKYIDTWSDRAARENKGLIEFLDDIGYPVTLLRDKYLEKNPDVKFLKRYTESDIYKILIDRQVADLNKNFEPTFYVIIEMLIHMSPDDRKSLLSDMKNKKEAKDTL